MFACFEEIQELVRMAKLVPEFDHILDNYPKQFHKKLQRAIEKTERVLGPGNPNMAARPQFVECGSMWLVTYECIFQVIMVSPDGKGFWACGQEPLWSFDNVTDWITEIRPNRHMFKKYE